MKVLPLSSESRTSTNPREDARLILFAAMWAIATLFHYQAFHKWAEGYPVVLAAIWLLIRPSQTYRLALLAALQVLEAGIHLPLKHNHWLLTTIVNLTILAAMAIQLCRSRTKNRPESDQSELFERFAPYVRCEVLILYFYAVFHKLNTDFFNPETSCGSYFYQTQATRFSFLPDSFFLELSSMFLTLFFEILIPTLLVSTRRRNLGVLVAFLFHGAIGFNPTSEFWNFSALMYALLFLFAPPDAARKCMEYTNHHKLLRLAGSSYLRNWLIGIGALSLLASLILIDNASFEVGAGLILWSAYMILSITLLLKAVGRERTFKECDGHLWTIFHFQSPILFLLPIFTLFNGMSPYLGLKTESSFAMFSNLRTEGGVSNHLLIPNSFQIANFQRDLVEIVDSSDEYLLSLAQKKLLLPYFEFKKYVTKKPDLAVTYVRKGTTFKLEKASDNPELFEPAAWYYRAFLVFRPVSKTMPTTCTR